MWGWGVGGEGKCSMGQCRPAHTGGGLHSARSPQGPEVTASHTGLAGNFSVSQKQLCSPLSGVPSALPRPLKPEQSHQTRARPMLDVRVPHSQERLVKITPSCFSSSPFRKAAVCKSSTVYHRGEVWKRSEPPFLHLPSKANRFSNYHI